MIRIGLSVLLLCSSSAFARDLTLTQQVRLTDTAGVPLNGTRTVTIDLHSHASNEAMLWSVQLDQHFDDGYASILLDVGTGDATIDSAWFADPVWVEVSVDNEPLLPRSRVTDVPMHVEPAVRQIHIGGTAWTDPRITLGPDSSVAANGLTITTGGTNDGQIVRFELAEAGEYPNGVKVELDLLYERLTPDADPNIYITDPSDGGGPEFCGARLLDQSQLIGYVGVEGAFPGTSGPDSGSSGGGDSARNPAVVHATWILPAAESGQTGMMWMETDEHRISVVCPQNIHVQDGVFLHMIRNATSESYRFHRMNATLSPL